MDAGFGLRPPRYELSVYRHLDLVGLWVVLDLAVLEGRHKQIADGFTSLVGKPSGPAEPLFPVTEGVPSGSRGVFRASRILPVVIYAGVPASSFLAVITPPWNC